MEDSVKESKVNSVHNLQHLYTVVVGLGLSLAIRNLIDSNGQNVLFRSDLLPFFFALLVTLIPFYHGALRHLDLTYVERGGREVRRGALLVDFAALFIESCLLLALGVFLLRPFYLVWGLVILLASDSLWGFSAHFAFTQHMQSRAEIRWALINLATAVFFTIYYLVLNLEAEAYASDARIWAVTLSVSVVRSVVDYIWCWDTYYPSL